MYDAKDIEDKIAGITNLAINTILNVKINEVKNKIPTITNLVTNAFLKGTLMQIGKSPHIFKFI